MAPEVIHDGETRMQESCGRLIRRAANGVTKRALNPYKKLSAPRPVGHNGLPGTGG